MSLDLLGAVAVGIDDGKNMHDTVRTPDGLGTVHMRIGTGSPLDDVIVTLTGGVQKRYAVSQVQSMRVEVEPLSKAAWEQGLKRQAEAAASRKAEAAAWKQELKSRKAAEKSVALAAGVRTCGADGEWESWVFFLICLALLFAAVWGIKVAVVAVARARAKHSPVAALGASQKEVTP